ncbi:unnamed protein product [Heligmosomoides polygyrus]|uniref:Uncharacterized protein n=1 Tax=Heligmosomoides polygyrus TaxID=6339 RepID=A0A183F236_HELPZ|nr:unnamed protein product [Heligmosomoides polygyrus]
MLYRKQRPYLRLSRFQGVRSLTREENSSSVSERRNQVRMRYRASDSKSTNLCVCDQLTHIQLLFTWNTSPLQSSRIELKYLLLPPRSELTEAPAGPTPKAFDATATTLLLLIRQVSCYTLHSGYRLPWPPSCCLYQLTPFMGSHERKVRHLNPTFVHPTAPVLLSKNGTLGARARVNSSMKKLRQHTH